jgi:hypothetical protein
MSIVVILLIELAGVARADSAVVLADLVKQLGDAKFARREAAQTELLRRGEGIVPDLDRLAKTADAETAERIRKIRNELVGYQDDLVRLLRTVATKPGSSPEPISEELKDLFTARQPRAGDFLLRLIADPKADLHLQARRTFIEVWESATPTQLDRFLQLQVYLTTAHRPRFPAKTAATIGMEALVRDDLDDWFPVNAFVLNVRMLRYLDGKEYGKPVEHLHPLGTVGYYRVGDLAEGKHTILAVLEYEFTHRGEKRKGEIRSKESSFEVVSADASDDLIAPNEARLTEQVNKGLSIDETGFRGHGWVAHTRWADNRGNFGLHGPVWEVKKPLDVDLCFTVEIEDVRTAKIYPAAPFVLRQGEVGYGHFLPKDVKGFADGRQGYIPVRVTLTPSRAGALSDPKVSRYYSQPIRTGKLDMKIIRPLGDDF